LFATSKGTTGVLGEVILPEPVIIRLLLFFNTNDVTMMIEPAAPWLAVMLSLVVIVVLPAEKVADATVYKPLFDGVPETLICLPLVKTALKSPGTTK
jgi:hypothetical protein